MKSLRLVAANHNTLGEKETTSITPRMQFVQFILVATSISNSTIATHFKHHSFRLV